MEQKQRYDYSTFGLTDTLPVSGMTVGMAITTFRQAKERRLQLRALAEQECCSEEDIKKLLLANGVKPQEMPRAPRPAKISTASPPPPEKIQQTEAPPVQTSPLLDELRSLRRTGTTWPRSWPRSTCSSTRCVGC